MSDRSTNVTPYVVLETALVRYLEYEKVDVNDDSLQQRFYSFNKIKCSINELFPEVVVRLSGSMMIGTSLVASGVDLITFGTCKVGIVEFFNTLSSYWRSLPEVNVNIRRDNRTVGEFLFVESNTTVHVSYAQLQINPQILSDYRQIANRCDLHNERNIAFDPDSQLILSGYKTMSLILAVVQNNYTKFKMFVKAVKHWARCNNLYGGRDGISGFGWTIMALRTFVTSEYSDIFSLLIRFFCDLRKDKEHDPIFVSCCTCTNIEEYSRQIQGYRPILLSTFPFSNVSEGLSLRSSQILRRSYFDAQDLLRTIANDPYNGNNWNMFFQVKQYPHLRR